MLFRYFNVRHTTLTVVLFSVSIINLKLISGASLVSVGRERWETCADQLHLSTSLATLKPITLRLALEMASLESEGQERWET